MLFSSMLLGATSQCPKFAVVEDFTNVGCGPCYSAHLIFEGMMSDYPDDLFGIAYHINYPDETDPMYVHAQDQLAYVQEYYDVFGVPHIKVGGLWAGGLDDGIMQNELSDTAPIGVEVDASVINDQIEITVEVTSCDAVPDGNYVIKIAVVEDLYTPNPPQNWALDFTEWHNIFRRVLPSQEGDAFVPAPEGLSTEYNITAEMHEEWIPENLKVIAYIQDDDSHDIVNAGINQALIVGVQEINPKPAVSIYPNPSQGQMTINHSGYPEPRISIYDATGKLVRPFKAKLTTKSTQVDMSDLPPGIYHCRLSCENGQSSTISFVIE